MSRFDCIMNYRQTILFLEGMYVWENYLRDVRLGVEGQQDNECVEMFHTYIVYIHTYIHTYIHAIFHVVYTDSSLTVYSRFADNGKPFSKWKWTVTGGTFGFLSSWFWVHSMVTWYSRPKTLISNTTFHEPKLHSVHNHSVPRTSNAKESVASNSTEIDGDERLQIGHYVAGFNLSLIGKEFNFDSSDLALVKAVLRDQTFKRKPVESIDAKTPFFDLVAPVTGCSSNHYGEFKHHIE